MNADKAMEIIDQIASKLGVAAEYIIPELARMEIAQCIVGIVVDVIVLVVACVVITKAVKNIRKVNEDDRLSWSDKGDRQILYIITILIAGIIGFATALMFSDETSALCGWLASPTAKSIEYVMGALK